MTVKILDFSAHAPTCDGAEVTTAKRSTAATAEECAGHLQGWDLAAYDFVAICPDPRPFDEVIRAVLPSGRIVVPAKTEAGWAIELPEKPRPKRKAKGADDGGE